MGGINMVDLKDQDLRALDHENEVLEYFAENYLTDALRIIATRTTEDYDKELLYNAVCIATSLYMRKLKEGKVHQNRALH